MKVPKYNKSIKLKYNLGGSGLSKQDYANTAQTGLNVASTGVDMIEGYTGDTPSALGGGIKGAASGAAAGAAFGVVGMGVGALAGGVMGYLGQDKANAEAKKAKDLQVKNMIEQKNLVDSNAGKIAAANAGTVGIGNNSFKDGGAVKSTRPLNILTSPIKIPNSLPIRNPRPTLARAFQDGGAINERLDTSIRLKPTQYTDGGQLSSLDSKTVLAKGNTHAQGGIDIGNNAEIENGETVKDTGDDLMVMSNNLKNPATGNTFAKDDSKLAKQVGKLEGSKKNSDINTIKLLNRKRGLLENMQQIMNGNSQGQNI